MQPHSFAGALAATATTSRPAEQRIILLGSTGSIGTQTLDVIDHLNKLHELGQWPTRYTVVGLAAGANGALLSQQASAFGVRDVALARGESSSGPDARVRQGIDGAEQLVRDVDCDIVLAAMVGSAGLPATLAAVQAGRHVALANKETLVAAGSLIVPAARASGSRLLPVDSEHAAVWQCLQGQSERLSGVYAAEACPPMACGPEVARVVLTASGGPFRTMTREQAYHATPQQALKHPTWSMGAKVTIDSASLTNKAFEVIEAHWLFGLESRRIGVLVHPQSIVHALVEFADGTFISQLGPPDMRSPIQYALTWPARPNGRSRKMDLSTLAKLEFEPPDLRRFPALGLAYRAIDEGGTSGAVFNAANEEAVHAFLNGVIPFGRIPELSERAMDELGTKPLHSLDDALRADVDARQLTRRWLEA